ncbi:rhodanese-like domain-containing protein [Cryomorphaceae bacterium S-15]|uniref:Rhodanese-like domain-containing protein n=2 Tax=Acidiluteibacter ferrifornacis TaxID=2692424 RepID=A0A6N9NKA5_9FLAO|nr:rhodanese-like domain-containing protein [Acidiluteibacter ferrifornacis]
MLKALIKESIPIVAVADLDQKQIQSTTFIDSREKVEFDVSHIKGATWVGYDDFDMAKMDDISKNEPIIIYCSVGYRSEKIGEKLLQAGYTNVSNLYGGIFEWVNQGKPIVDLSGDPTTKIHGYSKTWGIWLSKGEKVY